MTGSPLAAHFSSGLFDLFDETLDAHHGMYLDRGTSLFETLAKISAEEASRPVSSSCASIAAQVNHVTYYLDVLRGEYGPEIIEKVDWNEAWKLGPVTDEEWIALTHRLRESTDAVLDAFRTSASWDNEDHVHAAMAMLVHTAYHLGEIRQALCTISNDRRG